MLQIIANPLATPAVLSEGINAAPRGDDKRVKEFLTAAGALKPELANEEQDSEDNAIGDESAAHDVMRQTLACMVAEAEAHGGHAAEHELCPDEDGHGFSDNAMCFDEVGADFALETAFKVEFKVDSQGDLDDEGEHHVRDEFGVHVGRELAALVLVAKEVAHDGEEGAGGLDGDVPSGADYTEDHAGGEEDSPGEDLY
jgi:hypothetical protein